MGADYLAIAVGGALGTLARYLLSLWLFSPAAAIPWPTLGINVLGSLLLGYCARSNRLGRRQALFIMVGFLGAFTTFSTLAFEITSRVEDGAPGAALLYATATMVAGTAAAWVGSEIAIRGAAGDGVDRC